MSKYLFIDMQQLPPFSTDLLLPYEIVPSAVLEDPEYKDGLRDSYSHFLKDWCIDDDSFSEFVMPCLPSFELMVDQIIYSGNDLVALNRPHFVPWELGYWHGVIAAYNLFSHDKALELMKLVELIILGASVRVSGTAWCLPSGQSGQAAV